MPEYYELTGSGPYPGGQNMWQCAVRDGIPPHNFILTDDEEFFLKVCRHLDLDSSLCRHVGSAEEFYDMPIPVKGRNLICIGDLPEGITNEMMYVASSAGYLTIWIDRVVKWRD